MQCRLCGEENPAGAQNCSGCARPLQSSPGAKNETGIGPTTSGDHYVLTSPVGEWAVPSWYLDLKLALLVILMAVSILACLLAGLWALAILILVGLGGLLLLYRLLWKRTSF